MRVLPLLALGFSALAPARAQQTPTCSNFGIPDASGCSCPPGFSGSQSNNCDLPVCGGSLYRPEGVGAGQFGSIEACQCSDGWTGPACTVCENANACISSLTHFINSTNQLGVPGLNGSLVCNAQPVVYAASHMTCNVVQAMMQALFPGKAQLSISRYLNGSMTPGGVAGLQSAKLNDGVNEVWAQLWYNNTEQFYCHASDCEQTVTPGENNVNGSDWHCPTLQCKCRPGTSFCGGGSNSMQNLASVIDTLQGPLDINCDGTQCTFDQKFLRMFGPTGLPLTDCTFGECINQYRIDSALGKGASKGSSKLSGGVIAGLAVVGAIILAIILFALCGVLMQRKARKSVAHGHGSLTKAGGVGLAWQNVGYEVARRRSSFYDRTMAWLRGIGNSERPPSPQAENGTFATKNGGRAILRDVCGELPAGAFCCILGPSGAGKSTLVDILAGRRKAGNIQGRVSYLTDSPDRNVKIGYCDQSDVLSPTSTVLETLIFAAKLRLPESVPISIKEQRARTVLEQLGLSHIANTRVGSGVHRGISGGEMRRVSIGVELVANPDILILDEPTSGLDSVSAARIVNLLKSLTTDPECRTTIVASIHQPSSALYKAFSQVILLANGRQLYFGPGGNTPVEFFASQGRPCPPGYNIADHLLEVAIESEGLRDGTDAMIPVSRNPSLRSDDEKSHSHEVSSNGPHAVPTLRRASVGTKEVDLASTAQDQKRSLWPRSQAPTTFFTQFQVLAGREWRNLRRDKALFAAHFLLAGVVGVFGGGCFFRTGVTIGGFQNKVGSMFFLGSLIAFSSLSALNTIFEVRPLFLRERSSNFYSAQTWILSRIVFDIIPLRIVPTILLSIIVYFMVGTVGVASGAALFFKYLLITVEFSIVMVLYNFLVAAVVDHFGVAILLSSLWTMLNFIYAGFFSNTSQMPPVLRWIRYIAPMSYTLEALTVNWIKTMVIKDELSGVPIEISGVVIMETLFGFNVDAYYRNVLVLFAFIAGFGILLILGVFWFMREKR